jgi:hypothetical protein
VKNFFAARKGRLLAISCLLLATACQKHTPNLDTVDNLQSPSVPVGAQVTVSVHPEMVRVAVPPDFTGFSFETSKLTDSSFLSASNTQMIQMMKNLGNGCVRIGGWSSDDLMWAGSGAQPFAATQRNTLTPADIDRFAGFAQALGWPVIFGLNLGQFDTARAVSEAKYVTDALGSNLMALQNGNEVEVYGVTGLRGAPWEPAHFHKEWEQYFGAIRRALPRSTFAGPDVADQPAWISSFAFSEHGKIKFLDAHYYRAGPSSRPDINYETVLAKDIGLEYYLLQIANSGDSFHLPYRITECNSIWDYGKSGVSDVFASSLWALDFMYTVLQCRGLGINFHGGHGFYSPIDKVRGKLVARPEYYAMLAFHAGAKGKLVTVDAKMGNLNASVYACRNEDGEYVTLINKEKAQDIAFVIKPGMRATAAQVLPLTAPSLTSKDSVSFAGSTPDASGRFAPGPAVPYAADKGRFVVNVRAGSAAVVVIN